MGGRARAEGILRKMLQDLFDADSRGARRDKLARAHGYADGYMRAMVDLGVTTQQELLAVVLEERKQAARTSGALQGPQAVTSTPPPSKVRQATA